MPDGRALRIAGIACGAVGLASIATGIYFYSRAVTLSDRVTSSDNPSPSDHKAGKNAETMQWVFYGVGAAAAAGGAVLYTIGWRASQASSSTAMVAPLIGPERVGIVAQGTF